MSTETLVSQISKNNLATKASKRQAPGAIWRVGSTALLAAPIGGIRKWRFVPRAVVTHTATLGTLFRSHEIFFLHLHESHVFGRKRTMHFVQVLLNERLGTSLANLAACQWLASGHVRHKHHSPRASFQNAFLF